MFGNGFVKQHGALMNIFFRSNYSVCGLWHWWHFHFCHIIYNFMTMSKSFQIVEKINYIEMGRC